MTVKTLPDLSPNQVVKLQDALLANADALLTSALVVLERGHVGLARSLTILALEESGKAIAVHERRVQMPQLPDGEPFRCPQLDELWGSHQKKLELVHDFLVEEKYWFDVHPPDPDDNQALLGTIKAWSRRQDRAKQRGFYVDLANNGDVLAPADIVDEESLADLIRYVHQIGWQLRLGEHIEGKLQDQLEHGSPPLDAAALEWLEHSDTPELRSIVDGMRKGVPGTPLNNVAYRFNPAHTDRNPFRNLGKPGYEAEARELLSLAEDPGPEYRRRR